MNCEDVFPPKLPGWPCPVPHVKAYLRVRTSHLLARTIEKDPWHEDGEQPSVLALVHHSSSSYVFLTFSRWSRHGHEAGSADTRSLCGGAHMPLEAAHCSGVSKSCSEAGCGRIMLCLSSGTSGSYRLRNKLPQSNK